MHAESAHNFWASPTSCLQREDFYLSFIMCARTSHDMLLVPKKWHKNERSYFQSLCQQTGILFDEITWQKIKDFWSFIYLYLTSYTHLPLVIHSMLALMKVYPRAEQHCQALSERPKTTSAVESTVHMANLRHSSRELRVAPLPYPV